MSASPESASTQPVSTGVRLVHLPSFGDRAIALSIFVPTLLVLLIAAWLNPNPAGHGTHTQLGLAPCGFLVVTGLPCATCGMTTSFAHAAHGHFLDSLRVQPAGTLLVVLTAVAALVSGYALVTGASLVPLGRQVWRPRTFIALGVVVLAGWAYTIARTLYA